MWAWARRDYYAPLVLQYDSDSVFTRFAGRNDLLHPALAKGANL